MVKTSYVRDDNGNKTHVRRTSNDGTRSSLHEYTPNPFQDIIGDHGKRLEDSVHHRDGTTSTKHYN